MRVTTSALQMRINPPRLPTLTLGGLWPGIHSGLGQVLLNQTLPTANNPRALALHQQELLAQASKTQRSLLRLLAVTLLTKMSP